VNHKDRKNLQRLQKLTEIPKMSMGGGTQSQAFMGFVGYAKDAATAMHLLQAAMTAMIFGDDWEDWTVADFDTIMAAAEMWLKQREEEGWMSEGIYVHTAGDLVRRYRSLGSNDAAREDR